jgi:hypothetical protein
MKLIKTVIIFGKQRKILLSNLWFFRICFWLFWHQIHKGVLNVMNKMNVYGLNLDEFRQKIVQLQRKQEILIKTEVRRQFTAHNSSRHNSPRSIPRAQFTVYNSSRHSSPCTIHRAQFTAHNAPCTILRAQFTAAQSIAGTIRRSTIHRVLYITKK